MEFISGLQWGTGLSLGICVGLVAWVLLREGLYRLLGIANLLDENRQFNLDTLKALLDRNADPSEEEIRFQLANNLCRCTGYDKIIRSVQAAAAQLRETEGAEA